ncbi:MAG: nuclear transport factor 2 family protein [Acidimicrobiales bacterium]
MTSMAQRVEIQFEIESAMRTYCRGIDRLDEATVRAAFHPGAVLEGYGDGLAMTVEQFAPHAIVKLREKYVATQHRLSNITVDLRDDSTAVVESYVLAYHVMETPEGRTLVTFDGRYVDRFERRDGAWRIAHRHLRIDFGDVSPMGAPMRGAYVPSGRAGAPDPIWD